MENEISYADFLTESLEKNIAYSEFLAETIDKNISYSEFIEENFETEKERDKRLLKERRLLR
jgi:hypothetical protein